MIKKATLLVGVGVGYVLGTRAGQERYEQILPPAGASGASRRSRRSPAPSARR